MSTLGNLIYTQAFNFGSFNENGVDPRTGQYTFSIPIFETPSAARNCPPLRLSIKYNPLYLQEFGLGRGWSLNLSTYQRVEQGGRARAALVLSTGEHYRVTETPSSCSVDDQKLRSFSFTKTSSTVQHNEIVEDGMAGRYYKIAHKSGLVEILSDDNGRYNTAIPVKIYASTGRSLKLVWDRHGEELRLAKIRDGDDDLLSLHYTSSLVQVKRSPGTAESNVISLTLDDDGLLAHVSFPISQAGGQDLERYARPAWAFKYKTFSNGITCLTTVVSPAGLVEEVQHREDGHRLPGSPWFPYEHIPFSTRNFLGYGDSSVWIDDEDNLYRVQGDYLYTCTSCVKGGPETRYTYNKFHLLTEVAQRKGDKHVVQSMSYHDLLAQRLDSFAAQPPQLQLPSTIRTTYRDASTGQSRVETVHHDFDEWGNPAREVDADGTVTYSSFYPASGHTDQESGEVWCPADPHGFKRYLWDEKTIPPGGAEPSSEPPAHCVSYRYQGIPTAGTTSSSGEHFVVARQCRVLRGGKPISFTDFSYVNQPGSRDHGRPSRKVTHLPSEEQHQEVVDWSYSYDAEEGTVTEQVRVTTGGGGNRPVTGEAETAAREEKSAYSLSSGLVVSHVDATGITNHFRYDSLGRLASLTISRGTLYEATRRYEYVPGVQQDDGSGGGSVVTVTDADGVTTRTFTDGLGKVYRVERRDVDDDNNNNNNKGSSESSKGPQFRVVEEYSYDELGQCVRANEVDWLRSPVEGEGPKQQRNSWEFGYDDWGHQYEARHNHGRPMYWHTDPIALTASETMNRGGKHEVRFDLLGLPVSRGLLDAHGTTIDGEEYTHDGLGRLVAHKDNHLGHTTELRHDDFDRVAQIIRPGGHTTHAGYAPHSSAILPASISIEGHGPVAEQIFDGAGRLVRRTVGGRTTGYLYRGSEPEPAEVTLPDGSVLRLTHNAALGYALTSVESRDGVDRYEYDRRTRAITRHENAHSAVDLHYLPSGLLAGETTVMKGATSEDGWELVLSTRSTYSMGGRLQRYVDVNRQPQEISYDDCGRPRQLTQGGLVVTLEYDDADFLVRSRVKARTLLEGQSVGLTTSLRYDDMGRETERTVLRDGGEVLYQLSQEYKGARHLAERTLRDGEGFILRYEKFRYDSHYRLVEYLCHGYLSPAADGDGRWPLEGQNFAFDSHGNLVEVISGLGLGAGQNKATYVYDEQDRARLVGIANTHPDLPPFVRLEYDANGCLTRDEEGRTLEYDALNRLRAVRDRDGRLLSRYYYDATGKLICQAVPGHPNMVFSYRNDKLVAVTRGDLQVSYLTYGSSYWGYNVSRGAEVQSCRIWAADFHESPFAYVDTRDPRRVCDLRYTPYGLASGANERWERAHFQDMDLFPRIGFNGEWRDPVTGWYHLGNGSATPTAPATRSTASTPAAI
ncbi:hypothetical protein VTG60DRAFT_2941 [Thermothelomyces hinnuleus]